jgi:flagella basal body P-ring formation protein FlgA
MLLLSIAPLSSATDPAATASRPVAAAIERAVRARVGAGITVRVSDVTGIRLADDAEALLALPEPSVRIGAPARFLLSDARPGRAPVRIGEATAVVWISGPVVRATRPIPRGARLEAADVAVVAASLAGRPLRPLPSLADAIGARVTRDLSADAVLTRTDIVVEPIVRAGDIVRTHARVGVVDVVGDMAAAESGKRGDIIRVVNQETRRAVRARVLERGEVEVVHVR